MVPSANNSQRGSRGQLELVTPYNEGGTPIRFAPDVISNLRRMVTQMTYNQRMPRRLAMVSSIRGEGATYTSLALATTIASDLPSRVCVVELNWWWPGLEQLLATEPGDNGWALQFEGWRPRFVEVARRRKLPGCPGLAAVLTGDVTLEEALLTTGLPNLSLLPAGALPVWQRPVAARSNKLEALIQELSLHFDYLLLDVPAVLSTSDAIALASHADACCLVVRHGLTSVNTIRLALDELKVMSVLGVVLNQVQIQTPRFIRALIPQE